MIIMGDMGILATIGAIVFFGYMLWWPITFIKYVRKHGFGKNHKP